MKTPNTIILKRADQNDIPIISQLADKVWHQHYPSIITMEQISYMLNMMYSSKSLTEQMEVKHHQFYLIHNGNSHIGFISVDKLNEQGSFMLHKFYLDQDLAGKGSGTLAFNELLKVIQPTEIKLTVNRKNFRSINFYFKNGFKIDHVEDFDIGNGFVMEDFVMLWKK